MITLSECKELLQITNTDNDNYINNLIPKCEDKICSHCRNHFLNSLFDYVMSTNISFDGTNNKIELTGIENYDFAVNDYIRVYGSLKNDGVYLINEIGTGYIKVNSLRTIKTEDLSKSVVLTLVDYPEDIKMTIAQFIGYKLENYKPGLTSETIDDYSYTMDQNNFINGIPREIMGDLVDYKHAYYNDFYSVYGVSRWC